MLFSGLGFSGQDELQAAEAKALKAHNAAMRTITIMLPVRYNESPTPVHEPMIPPIIEGGPSHGPLSGQLLGALSREPPVVVSRWSARFDVPPPPIQRSDADNGPSASEADDDKSAPESSPLSPLSPGFIFNVLTGGRYQPPPRQDGQPPEWSGRSPPANDIQRQRTMSQASPDVEWRPEQLLHRYVELHRQQRPHHDGRRGDGVLKNDVVMTAVAYGLLGSNQLGDSTPPSPTTSTTTPATTNANRKRKFSAEYRHRASGRYRSYQQYPGRRRPHRRISELDFTLDSDDEDDEVLEALFGYDRPPINFRRVRRPSSSPVNARRAYGRKRLGDGPGDRRRRWRQRGDVPGKLLRRMGSSATPREKQAVRSRRPGDPEKTAQQRTKPDVGPEANSSRRLSLLHIVVSRQQDFAAPRPAPAVADHPGLLLEPRPLDIDALHSLAGHPFLHPFPPFLPVKPIISDTQLQQLQDRYAVSVEHC